MTPNAARLAVACPRNNLRVRFVTGISGVVPKAGAEHLRFQLGFSLSSSKNAGKTRMVSPLDIEIPQVETSALDGCPHFDRQITTQCYNFPFHGEIRARSGRYRDRKSRQIRAGNRVRSA